MSEQAIVLNELTKHYGKHRGINNLSFSVNQGEFFGFIGPNGAGKSTTIRTLMGLIRPTGGSASIFDLDCHTNAFVKITRTQRFIEVSGGNIHKAVIGRRHHKNTQSQGDGPTQNIFAVPFQFIFQNDHA